MSSPEPQLRHQATILTGRYWLQPASSLGPDGRAPLLVGCHGYGETALDHLRELQRIPGIEAWHVVAAEALHPFYKGRSGEVVRSWMTKDDREFAIADNIGFLQRLIAGVRGELPTSGILAFSGFSQGAAMAWRAALRSGWPCHGLIVLGGDLPGDAIDPAPAAWPRILLGNGREDPWYTEDKVAEDRRRLDQLGAAYDRCEFAAGHEWHADFHRAAGELLKALRRGPG